MMKRNLLAVIMLAPTAGFAQLACGPVSQQAVAAEWGAISVTQSDNPPPVQPPSTEYRLVTTVAWFEPNRLWWYKNFQSDFHIRPNPFGYAEVARNGRYEKAAYMEMQISLASVYQPSGGVLMTTIPQGYIYHTSNGYAIGADMAELLNPGDVHWSSMSLAGRGPIIGSSAPFSPFSINFTRGQRFPVESHSLSEKVPCPEAPVNVIGYGSFGPYASVATSMDCIAWTFDGSFNNILPPHTLGDMYSPRDKQTADYINTPTDNRNISLKALPRLPPTGGGTSLGTKWMLDRAKNLYIRQGIKGNPITPDRAWKACPLE